MTDKIKPDVLDIFQISTAWLAAPQGYLPSAQIYTQAAEIMRTVTQANIAYTQALMQANAALLAALVQRPAMVSEERPSDLAHRPDAAAT